MATGIGIVGAGFMARTYAFGIRALVPDARLVAVTGGTRAPALARDFGLVHEPTLEGLLARADIGVVILASPTYVHEAQTVAAAKAGRHVFTEKPIAASLPEIDRMIAACRAAGVRLGVNAVTRWRRGVRLAKELVDAGEIGEIRMVRHTYAVPAEVYAEPGHWILEPGSGSPFLDQGAHCNDAIRWFVGADAVSVSALYRSYGGATPGGLSAMVTFAFANEVMAQLWLSYQWPFPPGPDKTIDYLFVGSRGMLEVGYRASLRIHQGAGWRTLYEHPPVRQPDPDVPFAYPYAAQVQDFLDALRDDREPEVTGEVARKGIEMALAADLAATTGATVRLPLAG
jgi:myo-inositol 2-dehydrogenase/D-chiro-inositol 1-dehydrogenase